jgi:ribonuclease G
VSEEILVDVAPAETRVAVVEHGILQELHIERAANRSMVGSIYKGKVTRVLPGMQAAFIDIGEQQSGFLHAADVSNPGPGGMEDSDQGIERIEDYLREGQQIIAQVSKDPTGSKGARLTTRLSFSSRYLVYMPQTNHIGLSRQIESDDERSRLRDVLDRALRSLNLQGSGGFILRTAAAGVAAQEIEADLRLLQSLRAEVGKSADERNVPGKVYQDWQLHHRAIRDLARPDLQRITVNDHLAFESLRALCLNHMPELTPLLEHYEGERPLFELYAVEAEIEKALDSRVELKSGAYLLIEQTGAMTTIDVNTGGFVGHKDSEETVYNANVEAATELARQLRVRNLAGIIIIDFIDMRDAGHRQQVLQRLEIALEHDHARTHISGMSALGLVEMTRKRDRESLEHILCETCPVCNGRGSVKSAQTVCNEIFRAIIGGSGAGDADTLVVQAARDVVDFLQADEAATVAQIEALVARTIQFRVEPEYSREQFDIILLQ